MKKSVRTLCIVLVLALFALMAMGSGSGSSDSEVKEPSSVGTNGTSAEKNEASGASGTSAESEKNDVTVEEAVLLDENGMKITVRSLDTGSLFGPSLKLLIENSTDKNLTVQSRDISVNGYMVDAMMSCDVAAGKKANDELTMMSGSLKACGISTIADMEFSFHIFDSDSWDAYLDTDPITVKTSAAAGYTYTYDNSGHEVYNDKGVEIVVKGLSEDESIFGPGVILYLSNTSEENVCVQVRDVSVNGFMMDTLFSCEVVSGKHAVDAVTFFSSSLEENGIETIENIELSFHIFNSDSWMTIEDTAPVTISFQ